MDSPLTMLVCLSRESYQVAPLKAAKLISEQAATYVRAHVKRSVYQ